MADYEYEILGEQYKILWNDYRRDVETLEKERDHYKNLCEELTTINNLQQDTIQKYHDAMILLDAENQKLRTGNTA